MFDKILSIIKPKRKLTVFTPLDLQEPKLYKVVGKNPDTGRKKTLHLYAPDESSAIRKAARAGMLEPYTIENEALPQPEPPSDRQINYARDLGIQIPESATKNDISTMITRVLEEDTQPAALSLTQYLLDQTGVLSPYESKNTAIGSALHKMNSTEQCAFYAYAVWCRLNGYSLEDLHISPDADLFWAIGQSLSTDEKLLRSVQDRPIADFYEPNANTAAFKAVKAQLTGTK